MPNAIISVWKNKIFLVNDFLTGDLIYSFDLFFNYSFILIFLFSLFKKKIRK